VQLIKDFACEGKKREKEKSENQTFRDIARVFNWILDNNVD